MSDKKGFENKNISKPQTTESFDGQLLSLNENELKKGIPRIAIKNKFLQKEPFTYDMGVERYKILCLVMSVKGSKLTVD